MLTEKHMIQYLVGLHEEQWRVRRDGKAYGPYPSREAALTSAIDAAHSSGKNDRAAQVLLESEDGAIEAVWTSGLDSYPASDALVGANSPRDAAAQPDEPTAEGWNRLASTVLVWSPWAPL